MLRVRNYFVSTLSDFAGGFAFKRRELFLL
jgi:hypothetical protein